MKLELTKHHGLGNDFLVAFDLAVDPAFDDVPGLARRLCDRRSGVGADGLLVGESVAGFAASMTLYNADGSRAEMSGNGIRCFAQALAMRRGSLDDQLISTDAGQRLVCLTRPSSSASDTHDMHDTIDVSVDMGEITPIGAPSGWDDVGCNPDRPVLHLSVGNPHTVVGVDSVAAVDLTALGLRIPGTNLEIVEPGPEPSSIRMRVHERGAGITAACGTGACASAWAARSWGLVTPSNGEITVHMDGGSAKVHLDEPRSGRAMLIGPTVFVARVVVEIHSASHAERQLHHE